MKTLFQTNDDWNNLILRLTLGLVILPHGAQKLLGLFGGHGFSGTMNFFTGQMGIPVVIAFLVIIGESFGALGLILGFLTRIGAVGISCIMLGAIVLAHTPNGFFMNWSGNQASTDGFDGRMPSFRPVMYNSGASSRWASSQPTMRLHGQMDNCGVSLAAKVQGREPVWINIEDAKAREIADGDVVRDRERRGGVRAAFL